MMTQEDWLDYFQAINGRDPSVQEMADAEKRGEFVKEAPEAPLVEVAEPVQAEETLETPEPELPLSDEDAVAQEPFTAPEAPTQEASQAGPEQAQGFNQEAKGQGSSTADQFTAFANQAGEGFQKAGKSAQSFWAKQSKNTQTNVIMIGIALIIPFLVCLLAFAGALSDVSYYGPSALIGGLFGALFFFILWGIGAVLYILPGLLSKTDKKWLFFILSVALSWTFIGWVALLIFAVTTNNAEKQRQQYQAMMGMPSQAAPATGVTPIVPSAASTVTSETPVVSEAPVTSEASEAPVDTVSATSQMVEELQKLSELKEAGILTEEEFQAQKAKLLG